MSAPPWGPAAADWEGQTVEEWRVTWGVPQLVIHTAITSTNDLARELAAGGAPAGTTVLADHQSRGRGQRGRVWVAPPGRAVLLSVVLRPAAAGDAVPTVLPIRVGLSVAVALEAVTGLAVSLKWPNDLLVDGHKVAGVLCEGVLTGGGFHAVAGVGINVLQDATEFPPDLDTPAASLRMLGAPHVTRPTVAGAVAHAVATLTGRGLLEPAELRDYERRDILRGRSVTVDGAPAGTARGLTPDGALMLAGAQGVVTIRSGTVRLDPRHQGAAP